MVGISPWSARELVAQGLVEGKRWGRRILISYKSLLKYVGSMPDAKPRGTGRERLPRT
jgi:hypothetical protein